MLYYFRMNPIETSQLPLPIFDNVKVKVSNDKSMLYKRKYVYLDNIYTNEYIKNYFESKKK